MNLWLRTPDLKALSHMYRHAWHAGLKTTYYLRTLGASSIEKATSTVKKEVRGAAGETKAETATRDAKDVVTAAAAAAVSLAAADATTAGAATAAAAVSAAAGFYPVLAGFN